VIKEPFTFANGKLTENGRLKREAIQDYYHQDIDVLYEFPKNLSVI
jgi:long-subunit acyl-CoA synthetase (AMP-forming)